MMRFAEQPRSILAVGLFAVFALGASAGHDNADNGGAPVGAVEHYRSPVHLVVSPDGLTIYAADETARCVTILDAVKRVKRSHIELNGRPHGLALSPDGRTLYVAEFGAGTVAVVDTAAGTVVSRLEVGRWPSAVALSPDGKRLYVGNQDSHDVSVIDPADARGKTVARIGVIREPSCVAVSPGGDRVVVTNQLPLGSGANPALAAEVSILDANRLTVAHTVKLPPGSTMVDGACFSPDGRWAYVVHGLGRFTLPITQLDRGWVYTSALSIVDVAEGKRLITVLLDDVIQGAADPHSVVCSNDGRRLWISHSGVHEVSIVDVERLHELIAGKVPADLERLMDGTRPNAWVRLQRGEVSPAEFENDLTALSVAKIIRRASSGGNGPRGLALSPDNTTLLVANYYSGSVAVLDAVGGAPRGSISLGTQPALDAARRGEIAFHDATVCFQRWQSCASCHPNQGRTDGLRWDFLRDGIGNGKDTPSLVFVGETPPLNRRATRKDAHEAASTSVSAGHFTMPSEKDSDDLTAYMLSLRPEPNPHLATDGQLSESALRGKDLFFGKATCAGCHPPPYFTDLRMHDVGVLNDNEPDGRYDTPTLIEAHRTGPYLHDGRAVTLRDVLTVHNYRDQHGATSGLTDGELDDLVKYLRSL
ncbi:MAG TPA: hypothetical protein DD670_20105 [Planctomycetaceae bacterium]|nr:hypothetical protein [Planctomycetaceae bacterium]